MKQVKNILMNLTGKKNIVLVSRGNDAIKQVLKFLKGKNLLIQDQGGWLTYEQFGEKLGYKIIKLETNYGLIDSLNYDGVVLFNSMPGYCALQDMKKISAKVLINDISGSIGTKEAKIGDIIIGSFGKWKPISINYGGFIAFDQDYEFKETFDNQKLDQLKQELDQLNSKLAKYSKINNKIKKELSSFDIIHKEKQGINVIIKFNSPEEKQKILDYCEKNNYQHTLCPRYIRVTCDAVSIEVKRA